MLPVVMLLVLLLTICVFADGDPVLVGLLAVALLWLLAEIGCSGPRWECDHREVMGGCNAWRCEAPRSECGRLP